MFAGWSFDKRANTIISEELQAQLDDVLTRVESGQMNEALAAQEIQRLNNSAIKSELIAINGESVEGSGLGRVSLGFGLIAWIAAMAGAFTSSRNSRLLALCAASAGAASAAVGLGWILSLVESDSRFFSGAGAAITVATGLLLAARAQRESLRDPELSL